MGALTNNNSIQIIIFNIKMFYNIMHRCHSHLHQSINNLGFLNTVISLKKINVRLFHNLIYVALQK